MILGRPVSGQFDSDPSPWRKALVVAALPIALFVAVVVQLTVVNRLPLPGGTAPDLVLLLVAAVAVSTSPMTGLLTGFAGGLALDIAPPATHYAGEYALVFCLVGYFAAWIAAASAATTGERNPWAELGAMAAAVAAGEAGKAGLGLLLSDPDVTGPAIKHVLPGAIAWDLLLTPFAFLLVGVGGRARPPGGRARAEAGVRRRPAPRGRVPGRVGRRRPESAAGRHRREVPDRPPGAPGPEAAPGRRQIKIVRPNGPGRLWHRPARPGRRPDRQAELRRHSASALRSSGAGVTSLGRTPKLNFAGKSSAITPPRSQKGPGKGWIHTRDRAGITPPRRQRGPGKGWIRVGGGSAASGGSVGRAAGVGSGITVAGRRPPKAGWLRTDAHRPPAAANRARPGKGWLRKSKRPRANWYSSGPSTGWVRRSRSKDRWRSRRRSLSGAVMSGVRDLLPSGDRR